MDQLKHGEVEFWLSEEENSLSFGELSEPEIDPGEEVTLLDLLDKLLTKGVVVSGDLTLSVAGVDLLFISLRLLVTTADKAAEVGAMRMVKGRLV